MARAKRRDAVGLQIDSQEKLTDELAAQLDAATTLQAVEDLYRPYKPKRRTPIRPRRGLEPLAVFLKRQVNPGVGPGEVLGLRLLDRRTCPTARRPCAAPATSSPRSGPTTSGSRQASWRSDEAGDARLRGSAATGPRSPASSRCTTTIASRWPRSPRTATWPCDAERRRGVLRVGIEIPTHDVRRRSGRLDRPSCLFHRELLRPGWSTVAERLLLPSVRRRPPFGEMKESRRRGGDPGLFAEPPRAAPLRRRPGSGS